MHYVGRTLFVRIFDNCFSESGVYWKKQTTGFDVDFLGVALADANTAIVIGLMGKIIRTPDGGGKPGATSSKGPTFRGGWPSRYVFSAIAFVSLSKGSAIGSWDTAATNGALETRPFGIYTFDAGRQWKVLFVWSGRVLRALAFNTQTIGAAVGDSGVIFQSTNAGQSWDSTSSPTKGNPFVQTRKLMLIR